MTTGSAKPLSFEEGWPILQEEAINKLIHLVEGHSSNHFTSQEYMRIYTTVYNMCDKNNRAGPEALKLYSQYKKTMEDYVSSKVLPSIQGKEDEMLLHELVKRWNNHKTMTRWLLRFFYYLERYLIPKMRLPSLQETAYLAFYELVYGEMNDRVRDTVISLIDREREGEQIDQALAKNVLDIYVEMDEDSMKCYAKDFEESMLKDTSIFYSTKASDWIASKSYEDYMLKVEECLKNEEGRIQSYLRYIRKIKLLEVVEYELLTVHASKLEEKKQINVAAA
ncbi:cullin-1 isoform X1 [Nicotiana tabacum]|uniref:Cullin-1 isoform X1 n=1 Tax=Nicotiana tabacum TaxID=4097 RepID=A0A1S3ZEK1_TOBAC|nr:PREDICTED: cullin-1-like isoform X1 [Nicotiana tabacum]